MEAIVSTELKYAEFGQQSIRQTIEKLQNTASTALVLTLQWKDLDQHFTHTRDLIESRARQVQSMEDSNNALQDSIKSRFTQIDLKEKEVAESFRALEVRENDFCFKQRRDIENTSRKIDRDIQHKIDKVEETLRKKEKMLNLMTRQMEERYQQLNGIEKKVKEALLEFEAMERGFEEKLLNIVSRDIEGQYQELNGVEKKVKEGLVELQAKERDFEERLLEFDWEQKVFDNNMKAFRLAEEMFDEKNKEFEQKNTQLEKRWSECQSKEKTVENHCKDLESRESRIDERCKQLELKEKQFEERCKAFKPKENTSGCSNVQSVSRKTKSAKVKRESPEPDNSNLNKVDESMDANLHFTVTMDGKALQIFLNERWKEHDSMRDDVFTALQLSSNPAKLVLDAMHGFYPPHLRKDGMEFEQNIVMRSCILLLEQLTKISPPIRPEVWKEAKTLAFTWISKMKPDKEHLLQILGFIQLLVSYNLASEFDSGQLLLYMEIVADHIQAPDLLRGLHLADYAHALIQNLLSKGRNLSAVRFVYAFELVDVLSPVPLLRNCIESCMNPQKILALKQDQSIARSLTDVKSLIKCIEEYKLESEFPFQRLKEYATVFEEKLKDGGRIDLIVNPRLPFHDNEICMNPSSAPETSSPLMSTLAPSKTISPATEPESESALQPRVSSNYPISTCVPSIISSSDQECFVASSSTSKPKPDHCPTEPDGKCFKVLLSKFETHDKAFEFLRGSPNPEKLVLDEVKGYGFQLGVSTQHCILLLEQLRKCSSLIEPRVKEDARRFATKWRLKLHNRNQMEVVCFLHFIATYGLTSSFTGNKLVGQLGTKVWVDKAAELRNVIGLTDVVKSIIQTLTQRSQRLEAVNIISALGMTDEFPIETILRDHVTYIYRAAKASKKTKNLEDVIAIQVSRFKDLMKCIKDYKLESKLSPRKVSRRINRLKKQMVAREKPESEASTQCKSLEDKPKDITPSTPSSAVSEKLKEVVEVNAKSSGAYTQSKAFENKRKESTPSSAVSEKLKEVVEVNAQSSGAYTQSKASENKRKESTTSSAVSEKLKEVVEVNAQRSGADTQSKASENKRKKESTPLVIPLTSSSAVSSASATTSLNNTQEEKHESKRPRLTMPKQYHCPAVPTPAPPPVHYHQRQGVAPPIHHPYHRPPDMFTYESSAYQSARQPNLYHPVNLQRSQYNDNVRPFCYWNGMGIRNPGIDMPFWKHH